MWGQRVPIQGLPKCVLDLVEIYALRRIDSPLKTL
jgi:hypothetical protein